MISNRWTLAATLLCATALSTSSAYSQERQAPWDGDVLELLSSLPVQEGGRIKPLSTLAGFQLLRIRGVRKAYTPKGEKLSPIAWLADCLFFPEAASTYEVFLIQDSDVLTAVGMSDAAKKKRDRYAYNELKTGKAGLFEKARSLSRKDQKQLTPVEREIMNLARNVHDFEALIGHLAFTRQAIPVNTSPGLGKIYDNASAISFSTVLTKANLVAFLFQQIAKAPNVSQAAKRKEQEAIQGLARQIDVLGRPTRSLALFPPSGDTADKAWLSPYDMANHSFTTREPVEEQVALLAHFEKLEAKKGDAAAFKNELTALHGGLTKLALARNEYGTIPLEVSFYNFDWFYKALLLFVFAFLFLALSWLVDHKAVQALLWATTSAATLCLVIGITLRCVIRSRPPISTLYETILFITACAVIVSMFIEWVNRRRIALPVGVVMGAIGMFLAYKYELRGEDTMTSLVAVLDTNFWLATHVTAINLGYQGGLLASGLGHVYLLGKLFGKGTDKDFYKTVARMTYGVLCFGLLFSVVGTILGGVWANYSWGRFWGWDPKENGALLIVLWQILILHARMGGYIRDWGLCALCIIGGVVVAFSWFGVNLLGVGLHSYGFTAGVDMILKAFYGIELMLVAVCSAAWFGARKAAASTEPATTKPA
jgi:ABC-type transport system involved in cytochrome c biogenesis permease subunit